MALERYNPGMGQDDTAYFRLYAKFLLPLVKGKVLDLGCGEGWLTKEMIAIPEVHNITAVDKFGEQPDENQDILIDYEKMDVNDMEFDSRVQFDTIISTEFIEHITQEDLEKLLDKVHKWLKPDGLFIGSTPNKVVPTVNPFHLREYTKPELQALFEKHGFPGEINLIRSDLAVWTMNKA